MSELRLIEQILDLARWAPSGDNTQPWRFEIVSDDRILVHGFDTRDHCVYDLNGQPSQMAIGALLETISIAASAQALRAKIQRLADAPETRPTFEVRLIPDRLISASPLIPSIKVRSVQRRALSTRPLTEEEKSELETCVGDGYSVLWFEGWASRLQAALLMFANGGLRLTMPEAYAVHRDIIEWDARFSEDRVPAEALGLSPLTLMLMRPVMSTWQRVDFFNSYLGGTLMPRIELDLIPGLACAAHLVLVADAPLKSMDDFVAGGRAMQRFWLTATRLGLWLQPEMTPLIFATYVRTGTRFSSVRSISEKARRLAERLEALIGQENAPNAVFMARVGAGRAPRSRSVRLPLDRLLVGSASPKRRPANSE
jgi:nitroreductase